MKKLEMVIRPEKLDELKVILDECNATGVMVTNIMGYGAQKGFKRIYRGNEYFVNLLPKVKVETVVADDAAEVIIDKVTKEISTGNIGDGKIFVYDVEDVIRVRTGERGPEAI
ncbi:MAG: P-II family nitrogen regulator [Butyrivibrio sp.]